MFQQAFVSDITGSAEKQEAHGGSHGPRDANVKHWVNCVSES